jgi:hypothetical protein
VTNSDQIQYNNATVLHHTGMSVVQCNRKTLTLNIQAESQTHVHILCEVLQGLTVTTFLRVYARPLPFLFLLCIDRVCHSMPCNLRI